eukprot:TRINITY_DN1639_c0_g1_i1.p1 TRINITY_DN1639_c0_g1~~TRINITY_DN1639_c0_g1_i1.p1  ORF type:complete len:460 (+),score=148.97 TRINITY_DN1639_c0_g1_i1:38-1381(+)
MAHKYDNPNSLLDESKISENEYVTLYQCSVTVKNGIDLVVADMLTSDPYCEVNVGGMVRTTKIVEKSLNPTWNETFVFYTEGPEVIWFKIFDHDDLGKNDPMGQVSYDTKPLFSRPAASTPEGEKYTGTLKLQEVRKGSVGVEVVCKTMTPVKTEKLLAICEQQLKEAKTELDRQISVAQSLKADFDAARKELTEAKSAHATVVAQNDALFKDLQKSRAAHAEAVQVSETLKHELDSLRQAQAAALAEVTNLREELVKIGKALRESSSEGERLKSEISQLHQQRNDLQRALAQSKDELNVAVGKHSSAVSEIGVLNGLVSKAKEGHAALSEDNRELRMELGRSQEAQVRSKSEVAQVQQQLSRVEQALNETNADLEGAKKALSERDSKLVFLEGKVNELQSTVTGKNKEIEDLQMKLHDKEHEEQPIVVDADNKPFCVCCGAKCIVM